MDDFVEVGEGLARIVEPALVADLHVMRARNIRDRRAVVGHRSNQVMVEPSANAAGHAEDQVRDVAALFLRPDHAGVMSAVDARHRVAVPDLVLAPAGLQQNPVGERRRPRRLLDVGRVKEIPAGRFRRQCRVAAPFVAPGVVLLGPIQGDLVARRRLPGQPSDAVPIGAICKGGRVRSKSTTHEFGLPAFLLKNIPGIVLLPSA